MKEGDEKNIDRKFREGLANPEDDIVYNDADWDAMEELLDQRKKHGGFIFRLPFMLGAAAALLLLALGLFFFWPDDEANNNLTGIKRRTSVDSITSLKPNNDLLQHEDIAKKHPSAISPEINGGNDTVTKSNEQKLRASETNKNGTVMLASADRGINRGRHSLAKSKTPDTRSSVDKVENGGAILATVPPTDRFTKNSAIIAGTETDSSKIEALSQQLFAAVDNPQHITVLKVDTPAQVFVTPFVKVKNEQSIEITGMPKHPVVLTIVAAPDFNGVGSAFNRTQIGTNAGVLFSVGFTRKLTITTGAVYSKKPYLVGMDQYQTSYKFRVQPDDVSADCRVLDIPLNINYQVYNKGRNAFSVGTGLSSYFMLRENYHFNHSGYYVGPSDYNISNQNKHILGVVNLSATYQRRIGPQFGLNVQPYMKLPITNIGYGQVNLKSTGVAVGASWYLNTHTSPKRKK